MFAPSDIPSPSPPATAPAPSATSPQLPWVPLPSTILSLQQAVRRHHAQALTCQSEDFSSLRGIRSSLIEEMQRFILLLQDRDVAPPIAPRHAVTRSNMSRADSATSWRPSPPAAVSHPATSPSSSTPCPPSFPSTTPYPASSSPTTTPTPAPSSPTASTPAPRPPARSGKRHSPSGNPPPKRGQRWRDGPLMARREDFEPIHQMAPIWPPPEELPLADHPPVRRSRRLLARRTSPKPTPWFRVATPGPWFFGSLSRTSPRPAAPAPSSTSVLHPPPPGLAKAAALASSPSAHPSQPSDPPPEVPPGPGMRSLSCKRFRPSGPGGGDE